MDETSILVGVLVDEHPLTHEELARACGVSEEWLHARLTAGLLICGTCDGLASRFGSEQLERARRLLAVEQDFDANQELAALVVDLIDEIRVLRAQLQDDSRATNQADR